MRRADGRRPASPISPAVAPFDADAVLQAPDQILAVTALPTIGDKFQFDSPKGSGSVVLESVLGVGGEGTAYAVDGDRVVKIFDRDHLTRHRREKVALLVARAIQREGICAPTAVVSNAAGEFVRYMMPRARGSEFRVIMNPRRFLKVNRPGVSGDLLV